MGSLAVLAFRAKEAALRRGTFALLPEVLGHQHLSPEQIHAQSWTKLQQVVRFAAAKVPYYQQAWQGLDIKQALSSPAALAQLPILNRAAVSQAGLNLVAPNEPGTIILAATSGSSGEYLRFWSDHQRSGWSTAARIRARRWWGLDYGARGVRLYGRAFYSGLSLRQRLRQAQIKAVNRLCGITRLSAFDMDEQHLEHYYQTLLRAKPQVIDGYGGSLLRLAEYMQRQGLHLDHGCCKAVLYMSEPVSPGGRQRMAQAYGAPVGAEYVASEFGLLAHECPFGNLHLSDDNVYAEIVDPQGQPVVGQVGEIILTDLHLSRTPYIRYRLGDLGELAPNDYRCPCGCGMRVLRRLVGRSQECIPLRGGGSLPTMALDWLFDAVQDISHWQIRLGSHQNLQVLVEASPQQLAPVRNRMLSWLEERLNHEYQVTIQAVPHIAPSPSGKYPKIVYENDANMTTS